eukprot:9014802-Karenia_brevis.AAC.1
MVGRAQHEVVVRAPAQPVPFGETVCFPRQPMARPPNRETGEPDPVGTITAQIPVDWAAAPRYQWRHGTDAYAAPHI